MLRAIIIDDEHLAIDRLKRLLRPFKDIIDIIYETTSSQDAIKMINSFKPDLVFLEELARLFQRGVEPDAADLLGHIVGHVRFLACRFHRSLCSHGPPLWRRVTSAIAV